MSDTPQFPMLDAIRQAISKDAETYNQRPLTLFLGEAALGSLCDELNANVFPHPLIEFKPAGWPDMRLWGNHLCLIKDDGWVLHPSDLRRMP